jgi:hypothetical protein
MVEMGQRKHMLIARCMSYKSNMQHLPQTKSGSEWKLLYLRSIV